MAFVRLKLLLVCSVQLICWSLVRYMLYLVWSGLNSLCVGRYMTGWIVLFLIHDGVA
jgi:hypothetical protein